jgi:hypothetical protein
MSFAVNISDMPDQPLNIEDIPGSREGIRILRLTGTADASNLFGFQSKLRADNSRALILDFTQSRSRIRPRLGRWSGPMSRGKKMGAAWDWWV